MKKRKIITTIFAIIMIVAGVYCIFTPFETATIIPYVIALAMVADGIISINNWSVTRYVLPGSGWFLFEGIIALIAGISLLFSPSLQVSTNMMIIMIVGIWLVINGISRIIFSFKLKNNNLGWTIESWRYQLIIGIVILAVGIILILKPVFSLKVVGVLIGLGITISGINLLLSANDSYLNQ